MGTRKPGHNHGFDDVCGPSCDAYVERGEFGMPTIGGGVVHMEGGSVFDRVADSEVSTGARHPRGRSG